MKLNLPTLKARDIGRPKYRKANPFFEGTGYVFRQPFWDYYGVTVNVALTRQILFSIPQGNQYTPAGGAALVKTIWHTNMTQNSLLPQPNKLFVKAIELMIRAGTLIADAERLLNDTMLDFLIDQRSYGQQHAQKFPAAAGAWAGGSTALAQNGFPERHNQFTCGDPGEYIEQGQSFAVVLDPAQVVLANAGGVYTTATAANGGVGINAHVYLDGLYTRAVSG